MLLSKLKLRNFQVHRHLDVDFGSGINGIVGPNGSGKTSVAEAIAFVLLGITPRTKEESITVGETTGYVGCSFSLNGKEGYIERHLDSSRVLLKYDGTEYKKSADIKTVWSNMLNINADIFQNVIFSKQKEIALLFTGDNSTRERIFQKIFFVPNTGKLRDIIWNTIKQAPPLRQVTDIKILELKKKSMEDKIVEVLKQLEEYTATIDDILKLNKEKQDIEDAWKDRVRVERELEKVKQLNAELNTLVEKETALETYIDSVTSIANMEAYFAELNVKQNEFKRYLDYEKSLKEIPKASIEEIEYAKLEFAKKDLALVSVNMKIAEYKSKIVDGTNDLKALHLLLENGGTCPTCGSNDFSVEGLTYIITAKRERCLSWEDELTDLEVERSDLSFDSYQLQAKLNSLKHSFEKRELLSNDTLFMVKTFDYEELSVVKEELHTLKKAIAELELTRQQIDSRKSNIVLLESEGLPLMCKQKADYLQYRHNEIVENIVAFRQQIDAKKTIEYTYNILLNDFENCEKEISTNKDGIIYNEHISAYRGKLEMLFDAFHASNFPRRLIEKYTDVVGDLINDNLKKFNIKYFVEIDSSFKIICKDSNNRTMPSVSGGQEVIIGICLRLALYSLFGQMFPILILDEPSQNLDVENQQVLFRVIESLRNEVKLRQIFIIDHNEGLTKAVDHVIQFK